MKTTRRGLFGLFGGAAVVAYTKQLPISVVDTVGWNKEVSAKDVLSFDMSSEVAFKHNTENFSDIIMKTLIKQSHKINENISKNNALLLRIQNKSP